MNLESYQCGLQKLIVYGEIDADASTYLQDLVDTSRLALVGEIVCFWRTHALESYCVITSDLLKRMGRFDNDVIRFGASEEISPYTEETGMQFLHFMAVDRDALVAAVAKTEIGIHLTHADSGKEIVVDWPCNPEPVLSAIIGRHAITPVINSINQYRIRICRSLPNGYVCEMC